MGTWGNTRLIIISYHDSPYRILFGKGLLGRCSPPLISSSFSVLPIIEPSADLLIDFSRCNLRRLVFFKNLTNRLCEIINNKFWCKKYTTRTWTFKTIHSNSCRKKIYQTHSPCSDVGLTARPTSLACLWRFSLSFPLRCRQVINFIDLSEKSFFVRCRSRDRHLDRGNSNFHPNAPF